MWVVLQHLLLHHLLHYLQLHFIRCLGVSSCWGTLLIRWCEYLQLLLLRLPLEHLLSLLLHQLLLHLLCTKLLCVWLSWCNLLLLLHKLL